MDKNSIIGLALIGVIMFGFSWYGQKQREEVAIEQARLDSIALANAPKEEKIENIIEQKSDSVIRAERNSSYGNKLAEASMAKEEFFTIENDKMIITLSNIGGAISSVELKEYSDYKGDKLYLFDKNGSQFDLNLHLNREINTSSFGFKVAQKSSSSASLRLYADSDSYVEYVYTLKEGEYMVDFKINFVGMSDYIASNQRTIDLTWSNIAPQQEKGYKYEKQYVTAAYLLEGESKAEELTAGSPNKSEDAESSVKWVAFKQQFFSSIFVANGNFATANVGYKAMPEGSGDIMAFNSNLSFDYAPNQTAYDFNFYFGPNSYTEMKSYKMEFQDLIPLGWGIFGWINRFLVIPIFNFLSHYISNYGWIIFLLTVIIKLIIFPFTYKSYISMAKMRILKPEIDKLSEKYPNKEDAMKKQQEMMSIYSSAGASPMGGCLPMLFQFPVLIAMFRFFPASIELRGQSFLWATDLSSYDSILNLPFTIPFYGDHISLFALLMGVSMFFTTKLNMTQSQGQQQLPGMQFMTTYLMPVMLVVWFNSYSCALSYYYLLSNLITILQTYIIRRFVDDDKLHQQMKDNAKKPKKKSKWQARYEEAMQQQQQRQNSVR